MEIDAYEQFCNSLDAVTLNIYAQLMTIMLQFYEIIRIQQQQ